MQNTSSPSPDTVPNSRSPSPDAVPETWPYDMQYICRSSGINVDMRLKPTSNAIVDIHDNMKPVNCEPGRPMNLLGFLPDHSLAGTPTDKATFTFTSANRCNGENRYHKKMFRNTPEMLAYHGKVELIILGEHLQRCISTPTEENSWTEKYEVSLTKNRLRPCIKQILQTCANMRYDPTEGELIQQPETFSVNNRPFKPDGRLTILTFAFFDDLKPYTEDNVMTFHTLLNIFSEILHYQSNLLLLLIDPVDRICQRQLKELVKAINAAEEGPLYDHRKRILYLPTGQALRRQRFVPGTPQLQWDNQTLTSDGASLLSETIIRSLNGFLQKLEDWNEQYEIQRPGGLVQKLELPTICPKW